MMPKRIINSRKFCEQLDLHSLKVLQSEINRQLKIRKQDRLANVHTQNKNFLDVLDLSNVKCCMDRFRGGDVIIEEDDGG